MALAAPGGQAHTRRRTAAGACAAVPRAVSEPWQGVQGEAGGALVPSRCCISGLCAPSLTSPLIASCGCASLVVAVLNAYMRLA